MKRLTVFVVLVAAGLGYYLYSEVPQGWEDPWAVRIRLGVMRASFQAGIVAESLGLCRGAIFHQIVSDLATPAVRLLMVVEHLDEVADAQDVIMDGVTVRLFYPIGGVSSEEKSKLQPGMIYIHGGGWAMGNRDQYDSHVRRKVRDLGVVAISIEYRRAPMFTFPIPLEDCVTATKYFLSHAADYNVDSTRVAIVGDSAGGNLAAATCMRLRDDNFPIRPKLQVLIYPVLQLLNVHSPSYSYSYINDHFIPNKRTMLYFYLHYAFGNTSLLNTFMDNEHIPANIMGEYSARFFPISALPSDLAMEEFNETTYPADSETWSGISSTVLDPYLSPLLALDHSDLPQAYVSVCQYDVLRDDGIWYAHRLKEAGVDVTLDLFKQGFHSWHLFTERLKESHENMVNILHYMSENL